MNQEDLLKHLRKASTKELIENIAAGSGQGDSMRFRYHASVQEIERRNKRIPLYVSISAMVISLLSLTVSTLSLVLK